MSDPYYQQYNPNQTPPQYDQPPQYPPSGQYGQQPGQYPPSGQYPPPPQYPSAYQQPIYVQTPVYVATQAVSTSGWAIASLVCSLLSLSLLGVIFGHIGVNEINHSNGRVGGKGLAIAGLIIGYIELAAAVGGGILFALLIFAVPGGGATTLILPFIR